MQATYKKIINHPMTHQVPYQENAPTLSKVLKNRGQVTASVKLKIHVTLVTMPMAEKKLDEQHQNLCVFLEGIHTHIAMM